jgi:hypothetical protein
MTVISDKRKKRFTWNDDDIVFNKPRKKSTFKGRRKIVEKK